MAIEYIPFENFVDSGITSTESFDAWRQKINGIIVQLNNQYSQVEIDAAFVKLNPVTQQTVAGELYFSDLFKFDKLISWDEGIFFPTDSSAVSASTPRLYGADINIAGVYTGEAVILGNASGINSSIAFNVGKGIFEQLFVTGPTITLNGLTYTVPTATSSDGILTITAGNILAWEPKATFVASIAGSANTYLSTDINAPVGTVVHYVGSVGSVPAGWLQDAQTVSAATYPQLAAVLGSSGGNITIPNYATLHGPETGFIYIIKAKSNDVSAFNVVGGDGIQLFNTANAPVASINMTAAGGKIGLKVSSQFTFDGSGQLKIATGGVTSTEILNGAVTPAKLSPGAPTWDTAGNLTVTGNVRANDPISANHAVTKGYLDSVIGVLAGQVQKFSNKGSDGTTPGYPDRDFAYVDTANRIFACGIYNDANKWGATDTNQITQIRVNEEVPVSADIYIHPWGMHVLQNGKIYGRGSNDQYQLGLSVVPPNNNNVIPWTRCFDTSKTYTKVVYVGGGQPHGARSIGALASDGTVYIAGYNIYGIRANAAANYLVTGIPAASDLLLVGGWWSGQTDNITSAAVLGTNGQVWTWGYGLQGQMGRGTNVDSNPTPAQITYPVGMGTVSKLRCGGVSTAAGFSTKFGIISSTGSLWVWGGGAGGALGLGNTNNYNIPTRSWNSATNGPVEDVWFAPAGGPYSSSLLLTANDRKLYTCGYNHGGQLGTGTAANVNITSWTAVTPTWQTDGFPYVQYVSLAGSKAQYPEATTFVLANTQLNGSGASALYVYGYNRYFRGGTGDANHVAITTPKRVPIDAAGIVEISGNEMYTVIRKSDGRAYYAGARYFFTDGESWPGGYTDYFTPIPNTRSY